MCAKWMQVPPFWQKEDLSHLTVNQSNPLHVVLGGIFWFMDFVSETNKMAYVQTWTKLIYFLRSKKSKFLFWKSIFILD